MNEQNMSRHELVVEVVALRKQVADLKESASMRRRVEEALRASEELYRGALEEAPAGICRVGADGEAQLVNTAFARQLGYASRQEFRTIGSLQGLFASDDETRRVLEHAQTAESVSIVARFRRKDGAETPLHVRVGGAPGGGAMLAVEACTARPMEHRAAGSALQ